MVDPPDCSVSWSRFPPPPELLPLQGAEGARASFPPTVLLMAQHHLLPFPFLLVPLVPGQKKWGSEGGGSNDFVFPTTGPHHHHHHLHFQNFRSFSLSICFPLPVVKPMAWCSPGGGRLGLGSVRKGQASGQEKKWSAHAGTACSQQALLLSSELQAPECVACEDHTSWGPARLQWRLTSCPLVPPRPGVKTPVFPCTSLA